MATFNPTNPVIVGLATKKDHYDRVFENTIAIYDSLRSTNELPILAQALTAHLTGGCGPLENILLSSGRYVLGLPFDPDVDRIRVDRAADSETLERRHHYGPILLAEHRRRIRRRGVAMRRRRSWRQ